MRCKKKERRMDILLYRFVFIQSLAQSVRGPTVDLPPPKKKIRIDIGTSTNNYLLLCFSLVFLSVLVRFFIVFSVYSV